MFFIWAGRSLSLCLALLEFTATRQYFSFIYPKKEVFPCETGARRFIVSLKASLSFLLPLPTFNFYQVLYIDRLPHETLYLVYTGLSTCLSLSIPFRAFVFPAAAGRCQAVFLFPGQPTRSCIRTLPRAYFACRTGCHLQQPAWCAACS